MERVYLELIKEHFARNRQMLFLMGPRQVGKTTLSSAAAKLGSSFHYLNWDHLDDQELIFKGPKAVAQSIGLSRPRKEPPLVVFDEIHKYKEWKVWLKGFFDVYADRGKVRIIVTGSARLEMFNTGGESLMGRYFRYRIHPLSVRELIDFHKEAQPLSLPQKVSDVDFERLLEVGGFPEPFLKKEAHFIEQWKALRHQQLFKEEVRDLTRIYEVSQVELLAQQIKRQVGALSNYANLAKKVRVSNETVRRWIEVLSGLYYCFALRPWSKNISRSLLKEPKLYLWDWALVTDHGARGENFVASHLHKAVHYWTDRGFGRFGLYFLRNKEKREVDFIVTRDEEPWFLVEVKQSAASSPSKALEVFQKESGALHAFEVVIDAPYEEIDCFDYSTPVIVPAKTFLSQLV